MADTLWEQGMKSYIQYCNSNMRIDCSSTASGYTPPTEINRKTMKLLYLNRVIR